MHRLRIYLDTSVIGGCFDQEFALASNRLFAAIRAGRALAMISPVTTNELQGAPDAVCQVLESLPVGTVRTLEDAEEVDRLTEAYLLAGAVTERYRADAAHIGFATVYDADVLVSWNFRHIVNLERIHRFNAVNLVQGYRALEIRSPFELFADDTAGDDHEAGG